MLLNLNSNLFYGWFKIWIKKIKPLPMSIAVTCNSITLPTTSQPLSHNHFEFG